MKLRDKILVPCIRSLGIEIIGKPKFLKNLSKFSMILFADFLWRPSFFFGPNGNRCSMAVAAGHVKHAFSFGSEIPRQYIARQERRKMSDVEGAVGIGPGTANDNVFHINSSFLLVDNKCVHEKRSHPPYNVQGTRAFDSRVTTLFRMPLTMAYLIKFG